MFTYAIDNGGEYRLEFLRIEEQDGVKFYLFQTHGLSPLAVGDFNWLAIDSGDRPYQPRTGGTTWTFGQEPFMAWNLAPGHHERDAEGRHWNIDVQQKGNLRTIHVETWGTRGYVNGVLMQVLTVTHREGDLLPLKVQGWTSGEREYSANLTLVQ